MDPISHLRDELRRSVHGDAWHGPALGEALARVGAAQAAARPIAHAHSIWEIALHATGWAEEVRRRLEGGTPSLPLRGDWPDAETADEAAWERVRHGLRRAMEELDRALAKLPPERLDQPVGDADGLESASGGGVTRRQMLHGLAQHNAYHAGQVILLARAAADREPAPAVDPR